jgi:hypothetical protein
MADAFERRRYVPRNFMGRISVNPQDAGYLNYRNIIAGGDEPVVYVNHEEIKLCLTADPAEGFVECVRRSKGNVVIHGNVAQTEILKGCVVIRLVRKRPAAEGS